MPAFNEAITVRGPVNIENAGDFRAFTLLGSGGQKLTVKHQDIGGNIGITLPTPDGGGEQHIVLDDLIQTLKRKTLLTPRIDTGLYDSNGSLWLAVIAPPTTVANYLEIGNAASGETVRLRAAGGDNNISINLIPKGSGTLQVNGVELASVTTTVTLAGTQTLTNKTLDRPAILMNNAVWLRWRNAANTADINIMYVDSANNLVSGRNTANNYISSGDGSLFLQDSAGNTNFIEMNGSTGDLTLRTGIDFVLATTGAGTRIGTGTTQLLGFYGVTAIVQPASGSAAAVATTAATQTTPFGYSTAAQADGIITLLNELRLELVNLGLIKGAA
mgnify:FL=1